MKKTKLNQTNDSNQKFINDIIFNALMQTNSVPYKIIEPKGAKKPFLLSIPHCGTSFPDDVNSHYVPSLAKNPDDTDWFLEKLYDFASEMGITVIQAVFSRWVIDLNRDPKNMSLYNDGRIITSLCPVTDFFGNEIYLDNIFKPTASEVNRRLNTYFWPYHQKIDQLITDLKKINGQVLFWDAHSIRRHVKTIRKEPFPDLILGDNNGKTADSIFIDSALNSLSNKGIEVEHNFPFKGGYLTRSIGQPSKNVHALQLEMTKDLYMTKNETVYDIDKAKKIKNILQQTIQNLIEII